MEFSASLSNHPFTTDRQPPHYLSSQPASQFSSGPRPLSTWIYLAPRKIDRSTCPTEWSPQLVHIFNFHAVERFNHEMEDQYVHLAIRLFTRNCCSFALRSFFYGIGCNWNFTCITRLRQSKAKSGSHRRPRRRRRGEGGMTDDGQFRVQLIEKWRHVRGRDQQRSWRRLIKLKSFNQMKALFCSNFYYLIR